MPPRTRTRPDDDVDDAAVVDINSVVDLDLDQEPARSIDPFRVKVGGKSFTLDQPDAGLVMELENAGTTEAFLALIFDAQWPDVRPLFLDKDPDVLVTLIRQYGQHFEMDQQALLSRAAPSRAERRASARRPRRR